MKRYKGKKMNWVLTIGFLLLLGGSGLWAGTSIYADYKDHISTQESAINEGLVAVKEVEKEVSSVKEAAEVAHENRSKILSEHSEKEEKLNKEKEETKKMEEELNKLKGEK